MSVEAQNLFKLHYGIKICNSTNRAQDHGYGWEPGDGTRDPGKDPAPRPRSRTPDCARVCVGMLA